MEFAFLADRPEALATVARWYFDEWGHKVEGETLVGIELSLKGTLNRSRVPLIVLAIENEEVVGAAQLKFREMDIYPDREHWLGGVFVSPGSRGKHIGSRLCERVVEIAGTLNVQRLNLQTEQLDGGLYAKLGWKPCEQVAYKGRQVLVMQREIGA
jgi:GNAT superfamily N-acetyltransferase